MIMCKIEDSDGVVHTINIKRHHTYLKLYHTSYTHKHGHSRQTTIIKKAGVTWCATKVLHCIMCSKEGWYRRTTPWDPSINVAIIRLAPSSNTYCVFVASYEQEQKIADIEYV